MSGRIVKKILMGEGPDGEDVEVTIDTKQGDKVLSSRVISHEEAEQLDKMSVVPPPEEGSKTTRTHLLSADEIVEAALRKQEEAFSKEAEDLTMSVIGVCSEVALKGTATTTWTKASTPRRY